MTLEAAFDLIKLSGIRKIDRHLIKKIANRDRSSELAAMLVTYYEMTKTRKGNYEDRRWYNFANFLRRLFNLLSSLLTLDDIKDKYAPEAMTAIKCYLNGEKIPDDRFAEWLDALNCPYVTLGKKCFPKEFDELDGEKIAFFNTATPEEFKEFYKYWASCAAVDVIQQLSWGSR
jgi:hypothetical protein